MLFYPLLISSGYKTMTSRSDYFHSGTTTKLKCLGGQEWGEVEGGAWGAS